MIDPKQVKRMYASGLNQYEIARELNVTRSCIQSCMNRNGVRCRNKSVAYLLMLKKHPEKIEQLKEQLNDARKFRDFKKKRTGKQVACETCGKETYRCGAYLKRYNHHFCSFLCRNRFKSNPEGHRFVDEKYMRIKVNGKYVREHEHIWLRDSEWHFIPQGFVVHHKNLNKLDNRIENLACIPQDIHTKLHAAFRRGEIN